MLSRRGISFAVSVIFVLVLIVIGAFVAIEYNAMNGGKITSTTQSVTDTTSIVRTTSVATPVDVFNIGKWVASVNTDSYQPDDLTFNSNLSVIYLSGFPSPNITIVDPETHNASRTLTMPGIDAEHIVVDPKTDTLVVWVVTCNRPNAISSSCPANDLNTTAVEVNGRTGLVDHVFPLYPGFFAVDFAANALFEIRGCPNPNGTILNEDYPNCGFLTSYSLKSGYLISNFSLGIEPSSFAVNQASYATVFVSTNNKLLLINGTNGQIEEETSLPYTSSYSSTPVLAVDSMTNELFSLYENSSYTILTAINGTNGRITYASPIGSACYVDSNRYYVNPYTDEIYASAYKPQDNSSFFLIIDGKTGHLSNMLSTQGHVYMGSAFNPLLHEIYLLVGGGELISLPAPVAQTYVNSSLLADSSCSIVPV